MTPEATTDPLTDDSVRAAAIKAMHDAGLTAENWPSDEDTGTPPEVTPEDETPTPEPAPGTEAGQGDDDVPTEYFGIDLSDLPSEKRLEVINRFKEQDRYVQSVQQKAAELEKRAQNPPQEAPVEEETPLTDDDIMAAFGVSPDDPMYEVKKEMILPTAKEVFTLKSEMQSFMEDQRVAQFEQYWNTTLDQLEQDHGKLPITREELLQLAVDNNIYDPMDAYARVHLSGRKTLQNEVERFKADALKAANERKAKPPATQHPRSSETVSVEKPELLDPKAAAKAAAEKLGFDWGKTLDSMQG
jgi:hypothetical protein